MVCIQELSVARDPACTASVETSDCRIDGVGITLQETTCFRQDRSRVSIFNLHNSVILFPAWSYFVRTMIGLPPPAERLIKCHGRPAVGIRTAPDLIRCAE